MKIHLKNYEAFLIDYLDGNLSAAEVREVEDFLAGHPHILSELEELRQHKIPNEETDKSYTSGHLFRSLNDKKVTAQNIGEYSIAYFEGDLDVESSQKLEDAVAADRELREEFLLHKKIRFTSDKTISFPGAKRLRHKSSRKSIVFWTYGIAAAAVLLFGVFTLRIFSEAIESKTDIIAKDEKTKTEPVKEEKTGKERGTQDQKAQKPNSIQRKMQEPRAVIVAETNSDSSIQEHRHPDLMALVPIGTEKLTVPTEQQLDSRMALKDRYGLVRQQPEIESRVPPEPDRTPQTERLIITAVSAGIKGFNNLTENNLALVTEEDQAGNIQRFRIESENFGFSKKMKKDILQ